MSSLSFFPSFIILPLLLSTISSTFANNIINQTCQESSKSDPNIDFNFCYNSLSSATPATTGVETDLYQLGFIAIILVKHNCTRTNNMIHTMLMNRTTMDDHYNRTRVALRDCSELYSDAESTLLETTSDYKEKRFGDANIKVSSVLDGSSTCEQGFQDVQVDSPLSRENNRVFQLSAISLSIINKFG